MELKEKERTLIQDLQTQEQSCVEKYGKYAAQAKDPELKSLFETIQKEEQKHYDTLQQVLDGTLPACDCNDTQGKEVTFDLIVMDEQYVPAETTV